MKTEIPAVLCEHANECPSVCPCPENCYCRRVGSAPSCKIHVEQPMPVKHEGGCIQDLVIADIEKRKAIGLQRYGTLLQPFNGRDALRDAYEEALDLCQYLRQVIEERDRTTAANASEEEQFRIG
jgi:hypothetical protein